MIFVDSHFFELLSKKLFVKFIVHKFNEILIYIINVFQEMSFKERTEQFSRSIFKQLRKRFGYAACPLYPKHSNTIMLTISNFVRRFQAQISIVSSIILNWNIFCKLSYKIIYFSIIRIIYLRITNGNITIFVISICKCILNKFKFSNSVLLDEFILPVKMLTIQSIIVMHNMILCFIKISFSYLTCC